MLSGPGLGPAEARLPAAAEASRPPRGLPPPRLRVNFNCRPSRLNFNSAHGPRLGYPARARIIARRGRGRGRGRSRGRGGCRRRGTRTRGRRTPPRSPPAPHPPHPRQPARRAPWAGPGRAHSARCHPTLIVPSHGVGSARGPAGPGARACEREGGGGELLHSPDPERPRVCLSFGEASSLDRAEFLKLVQKNFVFSSSRL